MMACRYKLVTFDITNTLLKFRITVGEQYSKVASLYGLKADPNKLNSSFKQNWITLNSSHPNFGASRGLTPEQWWEEIVKRTFTGAGSNADNQQLCSIARHLYQDYGTKNCWSLDPDAFSTLKELKQKGVTVGIISNTDNRLNSVLLDMGIKEYFNFVLTSTSANCSKPSREIFDMALQKINRIKSNEAIHIGDNVQLDYIAAKNAGWNALLILRKKMTDTEMQKVNSKDVITEISSVLSHVL